MCKNSCLGWFYCFDEEVVDDLEEYEVVDKNELEEVVEENQYAIVKDMVSRARVSELLHYSIVIKHIELFKLNCGYIVYRGGKAFLTPFPGIDSFIPLEFPNNVSKPKDFAYICVNKYRVIYKPLKKTYASKTILVLDWEYTNPPKIKPSMSFREYTSLLLDGVEVVDKVYEKILVLEPLSSPPIHSIRVKGGIHTGLMGNKHSYIAEIIKRIYPRVKSFYDLKKISWRQYNPLRYRRVRVNELGVLATGLEQAIIKGYKIPGFDGLVLVSNAPYPKKSSAIWFEHDIKDYLLTTRTWTPLVVDEELYSILNELSEAIRVNIEKLRLSPILVGEDSLINPSYTGTPMSILRFAQAIARSKNTDDPTPYLREAADLIIKAVYSLETIISNKPSAIPLSLLETIILKILDHYGPLNEEEIHQHLQTNYKHLYHRQAIDRVIQKLRRRGYVYQDTRGKYHIVNIL